MATGVGGYSTNGMTIATVDDVDGDAITAFDTQNPNGAPSQTLAVRLADMVQNLDVATGITAYAGGGQTNATQLDYGVSVVTVVATAADSVKLPPAAPGRFCFIRNADAADSTTVYGYGTDTIDGVASATGNAQAAGKGKLYFGITGAGDGVAGTWVSLLGA